RNSRRCAYSCRTISTRPCRRRPCRRRWRRSAPACRPEVTIMIKTANLLAALAAMLLGAATMALPAQAQQLDLDQVFRCAATEDAGIANCAEARDLILNNCTVCHTFVPIVMQQFDSNGWTSLL